MSAIAHPFLAEVSAFEPIPLSRGKSFILSYPMEIHKAGVYLCQYRSPPASAGGAYRSLSTNTTEEKDMSRKQKTQAVVRKPTKKIGDSRRVRFGSSCAPAKLVCSADAAISDSGAVRFGSSCAPSSLRK